MSLRKLFFQAHWLIGVTAGVVLALVGITGALLSFEPQIVAHLDSDVRHVESRPSVPLAAPQLLRRVAAANPQRRIVGLGIGRQPRQFVRVTFAPSDASAAKGGRGRGEQRYVSPETGAVLATAPGAAESFFRNVRQLHRWLMLGDLGSRDVGRQVVGASTLLLIVLASTGLYLRWPRGSAVRKVRMWLIPNLRLKGRALLWNLHAVVGTWMLPVYVLIALTGLQWSYEWYRNALYAIAGVDQQVHTQPGSPSAASAAHRPTADLTRAWGAFTRATPNGFSLVTLDLTAGPQAVEFRYLELDPPHDRAFNTLVADQRGAVIRHERYEDKRIGAQLLSSIFPLHSGSYFGIGGVIAFMLASLAMPAFAATGWIMYAQRRTLEARRARIIAAGGNGAGTEAA